MSSVSGIYRIVNIETGKNYVGQSQNVKKKMDRAHLLVAR